MSGYVSNFLYYTVECLTDLKINGKSVSENDVISVLVGDDIVIRPSSVLYVAV